MTTIEDRAVGGDAGIYATARRAMIDSQLRTSGINDPWVLTAMMRVPRERFVPAEAAAAAYTDRAVPLGGGRFLAAPLFHAMALTEAAPRADERALLVGDGQGYLAELLRPLLGTLDAAAPGGDAPAGEYALLVIDGAVEHLPDALTAPLAEGGRIVCGVVERGVTRFATGRKTGGRVALLPLAEIGIPVLAEYAAPKRWTF